MLKTTGWALARAVCRRRRARRPLHTTGSGSQLPTAFTGQWELTRHRVRSENQHRTSFFFFFFNLIATLFIYLFIYLYLFIYGCVGSSFRARAFSSCGERGPLFIAVRGPLTMAASLVAEHRLQTRRLSSCGSRAQPLHGMWDLPRPGLEPASPALAGRFSTTAPPGKPWTSCLNCVFFSA